MKQFLHRVFTELKRRHVFRVGVSYAAVAWVLIEVSATTFPMLNLPEWGPTAVLITLLIGLPFVLIFAWVYQITPDGVKRDTGPASVAEVFDSPPPSDKPQIQRAVSQHSIAVLPFVNTSDDADNEYFSDGLSEELLNLLARIPELHVAARTSSFSFKGEKADIPTVANKLNVANVLEGSVRKSGNQVRITAQLVEADGGYHLWSDSFDRTLDDIFTIQDEIAEAVVAALKIRLLGEAPKTRETDPQAYALYLQAMHCQRTSEPGSFERAEGFFRQVLGLDPEYAPAWAGLARNYWFEVSGGFRKREEGIRLAVEACDRALEADPSLLAAYTAKVLISMMADFDWVTAEFAIDKARQLGPGSADVALNAGHLAKSKGDLEQATEHLEKAISLDPLNTTGHIWLSLVLITLDRLAEARDVLNQALSLYPARTVAHSILSRIFLLEDDPQGAYEEILQEPAGYWRDNGMVLALHALGRYAEAETAFQKLIADYFGECRFQKAEIHAFRGETDEAFAALDEAYSEGDGGLSEACTSQFLRPIHQDPRWEQFLHKLGLSQSTADLKNSNTALQST